MTDIIWGNGQSIISTDSFQSALPIEKMEILMNIQIQSKLLFQE